MPWKYRALLLSLVAHFFLILLIDNRLVLPSQKKPVKSAMEPVISIRLVNADNGVTAQESIATDLAQQSATATPPKPAPAAEPESTSLDPQFDSPANVFEILLPPPAQYFGSKALTEKPRVLVGLPSDLGTTISGQLPGPTYFRLQINERGEVDRVIVDETSFSEEEQGIVIAAFKNMKFSPGKIDDRPVKTELKFEVIVVERTAPAIAP